MSDGDRKKIGPQRDDLESLVSARFDESASETESAELETRLLNDPAARSLYLDHVEIHAELVNRGARQRGTGQVAAIDEAIIGSVSPEIVRAPGRWAQRGWKIATAAVAASVLIGSAVLWNPAGPSSASEGSVATATIHGSTSDCRWFVDDQRIHGRTADVRPNDEICVVSGELSLEFASGVDVSIRGPAVLTALSPMRARMQRGSARASVSPGAEGFTIETPSAEVVDLGTVFGVGVSDSAVTRVAVFEGEVDVTPTVNTRRIPGRSDPGATRLRIGEGIELDSGGTMRPLTSIVNGWFPDSSQTGSFTIAGDSVISHVSDNMRTDAGRRGFYEIVPGGLQEDARAYADRGYHEWNGWTKNGMPLYLVGADYVKMFNNRKFADDFELYVTVDQPATLYIFIDDRAPVPDWLEDQFEDTGDSIAIDEGPHIFESGAFLDRDEPGIGPGVSVDVEHSVWKRVVRTPDTIICGAIGKREDRRREIVMYGVAASPLPSADRVATR